MVYQTSKNQTLQTLTPHKLTFPSGEVFHFNNYKLTDLFLQVKKWEDTLVNKLTDIDGIKYSFQSEIPIVKRKILLLINIEKNKQLVIEVIPIPMLRYFMQPYYYSLQDEVYLELRPYKNNWIISVKNNMTVVDEWLCIIPAYEFDAWLKVQYKIGNVS